MSKLTLFVQDEAGALRPATKEEILSGARAALAHSVRRGRVLDSPRAVQDFLMVTLGNRLYESFGVCHLDARHRVIECHELFRGTIDGATVHPREVVREALARGTAAVVFFHSHPSGVAEPSQADECITKRLVNVLALHDIRVLDHLIVAGCECLSFSERGLL